MAFVSTAAPTPPWQRPTCCDRSLTVLAELGDVTRFGSARQLMSYLGLTPSEYSSGARQRRGPITKTGNSHVRRILVESAWHYRDPPRVGAALRKRREGQPGWAVVLAGRRPGSTAATGGWPITASRRSWATPSPL